MKKFLLVICLFMTVAAVYSQSIFENRGKDVSIDVREPVYNQKNSGDLDKISGIVRNRIVYNILEYTEMTVVDSQNRSKNKEALKVSQSFDFDEDSVLEGGQFLFAKYAVDTELSYIDNMYSIFIKITDIQKSQTIASYSLDKPCSIIDIQTNSAIDKCCYGLMESLGYNLTLEEKNKLINAQSVLTSRDIQREVELKNKEIEEQKELLEKYKNDSKSQESKELQKIVEKQQNALIAKLEAEKQALEKRAEQKRQDEKRAAEQKKKEQTEMSVLAKQLDSKRNELELIKEQIFNEQKASMSAEERVVILENKKKVLNQMIEETKVSLQKIDEEYDKKITVQAKELTDEAYLKPALLTSDGSLSSAGKKFLSEKEEENTKRLNEERKARKKLVMDTVIEIQNELIKEIKNDGKELSKQVFTEKNILDEESFIVRFDTFDGEYQGWNVTLVLYFQGVEIWSGRDFVSYKDVTGQNPVLNPFDSDFDKYNDTIEIYNRMFLDSEPVIQAEIDYTVIPEPQSDDVKFVKMSSGTYQAFFPDTDSSYNINVKEYRFTKYDGKKSSVVKKTSVKSNYLFHCKEKYRVWTIEDAVKMNKEIDTTIKKKTETDKMISDLKFRMTEDTRLQVSGGYEAYLKDFSGLNLGFTLCVPFGHLPVFGGIKLDAGMYSEKYSGSADSTIFGVESMTDGFSFRGSLLLLTEPWPSPKIGAYLFGGCGYYFSNFENAIKYRGLSYTGGIGVSFRGHIGSNFGLSAEYALSYDKGLGYRSTISGIVFIPIASYLGL